MEGSWASWDENELLPTVQTEPESVKTLRVLINCSLVVSNEHLRGVRLSILQSNVQM